MNDMTQPHLEICEIVLTDSERQRCEVWTRVMGYHRPVASFNIGKKGEYFERRFFEEGRAGLGSAEHLGRAGAPEADSTTAATEMSCRRPSAGLGSAEHAARAGTQAVDTIAAAA